MSDWYGVGYFVSCGLWVICLAVWIYLDDSDFMEAVFIGVALAGMGIPALIGWIVIVPLAVMFAAVKWFGDRRWKKEPKP